MKRLCMLFLMALFAVQSPLLPKSKEKDSKEKEDKMSSATFNGMSLRLIGPAVISGRIVDIAVNPQDRSNFFIAAADGGVWKTTNSGTSFTPVFDKQGSFSIGCVVIDQNNPSIVWVGSGENNSQRSVDWGDGIYKSVDGGTSWKNMGLKASEHIGKIVIDPRNSNVVYVAAQGPLWGPGGDRGLYKTTDGGETWEQILKISENTGCSDIAMDPRNPDVLYVSAYQRRRHVWTLIDGGPEAAIYKTIDGGKTFNKLTNGIPGGDLGRIGLAVSPVNPDIVYAIIEEPENKGGFFRSLNRGGSWERMSDYSTVSAQYYQEIFCDPKNENRIYLMDTYLKISEDGGRTWQNLGNNHRHVDDHAFWINPSNTNNVMVGGDGGLYESYDRGKNWRFFTNLPITQFYRITTDNSEPFYYVYGGTQDNSSWGAPSHTINSGGITNEDWFLVVGGDGYEPQVDPKDPNIVYGQSQYGGIVRYDRKSGEQVYIQPQPEPGEQNRWNWDTPLIISPHSNTRLYMGANRLYRSDDRGNTWRAVSPDLTRQIDRNKLEVMGKVWGPEAVAKNASTSLYGNFIYISESPVKENLIYVGTDDGLIQMTDNGGGSWTKYDKFPGVPETTYVSIVKASQHNENVVYAAFNNHKNADFKPYLLRSDDKGRSWTSIVGNLPENGPVWTIAEDHVNPNLLFAGTEFGLYFTVDGGKKWVQLKGNFPIISVRDLDIQKRENDLVVGTFGRGIYILDNYAPLRDIKPEILDKDTYIFPVKDAVFYNEDYSRAKEDQGESFFRGKNPAFGATFTYYLKEGFKTRRDMRIEAEKKIAEEAGNSKSKTEPYYPSFDTLRLEDIEESPYLIFTITDAKGSVVRRLTSPASPGINRMTWDLRYPDVSPVSEKTDINKNSGMPVVPGKYKVTISKNINGVITDIAGPVEFNVKLLNNVTLPASDVNALAEFQQKAARLQLAVMGANRVVSDLQSRMKLIRNALYSTASVPAKLIERARDLELKLDDLNTKLTGNESLSKRNENQTPSITDRLYYILYATGGASSDPTTTAKNSYKIISQEFQPVLDQLRKVNDDVVSLEKEMQLAGSPWIPGMLPDWKPE